MMVLFWFALMSESDLPIMMSSLYVPAATLIVSLGDAAATAAPIVAKQPFEPPGFTHKVAATAVWAIPASRDAPNAISVRRRKWFSFMMFSSVFSVSTELDRIGGTRGLSRTYGVTNRAEVNRRVQNCLYAVGDITTRPALGKVSGNAVLLSTDYKFRRPEELVAAAEAGLLISQGTIQRLVVGCRSKRNR